MSVDDRLVVAMAREMRDGDRIFCGANQTAVALAAMLARRLWAPRLKLWASSVAHLDPARDLVRAGRSTLDHVLVEGRDATFRQAQAFDDALRTPVVFAGGLQVDARGNANLAGIRADGGGWRLRGPGGAGLPSLTALAERFFVMVPDHAPRALVERCSALSVVGDPPAREAAGLRRDALVAVLTPIARFEPSDEGLVLTEVAEGMTAADVAERTGFEVRAAQDLATRPALTGDEARVLAELHAASDENRRVRDGTR